MRPIALFEAAVRLRRCVLSFLVQSSDSLRTMVLMRSYEFKGPWLSRTLGINNLTRCTYAWVF